jgi:tetratricopeptide (TPR) repeat protein
VGSSGWLRLLACEVAGLRFQWPALRIEAQAQWDLKDYEGARKTWERIRDNDPDDLFANLALANVFERQFKLEKRPELLESSNLAIAPSKCPPFWRHSPVRRRRLDWLAGAEGLPAPGF